MSLGKYCNWLSFSSNLFTNFRNNVYRLDSKAVQRLDGPMLLRLQELRKEVKGHFFLAPSYL